MRGQPEEDLQQMMDFYEGIHIEIFCLHYKKLGSAVIKIINFCFLKMQLVR